MSHYNDPYTFLSDEEVARLERLDDRTRCCACNTLTPNNEIRQHNGDNLCSYCYNEWTKAEAEESQLPLSTVSKDKLLDFGLALSVACSYIKFDSNMDQVYERLKELCSLVMKEYNEEPIAVECPYYEQLTGI